MVPSFCSAAVRLASIAATSPIESDLLARRTRAEQEGWLGEIGDIGLTLTFLRQKGAESQRLARIAPVSLGMPRLRSAESDR
ncbi:hypothetical protein ADL29_28430 [Streptomyces chattanoogensis]|uniref:Recombinase n=1 Tax=Streptomyces chattanoogensis TaxID=66876 RepID=A0A0N0GX14_9ACTN|nr:hypothetical protein ADL29_28430 [Streptomyces chattanoogensis]